MYARIARDLRRDPSTNTTNQADSQPETPKPQAATYERPMVESVLTAEELAREIQDAGLTV